MATVTIGTGGTYTSLQAWIDALPSTLSSGDEIGQCLNQTFTLTTPVAISGITTSPTNRIIVECAAGASFKDHADRASHALRPDASYGTLLLNEQSYSGGRVFLSSVADLVLRGLQIDCTGGAYQAVCADSGSSNLTIEDCVIRTAGGPSVLNLYYATANLILRNVVVIAIYNDVTGIIVYGSPEISRCTVVCPAQTTGTAIGIDGSYGTPKIKGTAVFNFANPSAHGMHSTSDYNATDQASFGVDGDNSHTLTSRSFSGSFENAGSTASAIDCRLKAGSTLIDAGVAITGVTADIIGTTIPQGSSPDIGAWEAPATSDTTPPTLSDWAVPSAGTTVTATLSEAGCAPASGSGGFTLTNLSHSVSVTGWAISGTTLTLSLSDTIYSSDVPKVAYSRATTTDDIADAAGNFLADFSDVSVTNDSTQILPLTEGAISFVGSGPEIGIQATATDATGGVPPYSYQWQVQETANPGYVDVPGATTLTLDFATADPGIECYDIRVQYTDSADPAAVVTSDIFQAMVYPGGMMAAGGPIYLVF